MHAAGDGHRHAEKGYAYNKEDEDRSHECKFDRRRTALVKASSRAKSAAEFMHLYALRCHVLAVGRRANSKFLRAGYGTNHIFALIEHDVEFHRTNFLVR
jgi:hypothetical protein